MGVFQYALLVLFFQIAIGCYGPGSFMTFKGSIRPVDDWKFLQQKVNAALLTRGFFTGFFQPSIVRVPVSDIKLADVISANEMSGPATREWLDELTAALNENQWQESCASLYQKAKGQLETCEMLRAPLDCFPSCGYDRLSFRVRYADYCFMPIEEYLSLKADKETLEKTVPETPIVLKGENSPDEDDNEEDEDLDADDSDFFGEDDMLV